MQNKKDKKSINTKYIYLFISICIAILLICPNDVLWAVDRENYLTYAISSDIIFNRYISRGGILALIVNEPVFLLINMILEVILSPENVIRMIIFTSTIIVLYSLGKLSNYSFWVIIIFLIFPQVLKNYVIHLRQGLALSIYLLGISSTNKLRYIKYLSPFIHTSFCFIITFEIIDYIIKQARYKYDVRLVIATGILSIIPLVTPYIANAMGDRRASVYTFGHLEEGIGLGFLIWMCFGIFYIYVINKNNKINMICCYGIIFYAISYFLLDFSARIFENIVPILVISGVNVKEKSIRNVFILFFIGFGIMQYGAGTNWSI